ncbi:MAG: hypothetical protein H0V61_05930 [Chitinophagales bacterium]|nr:hypothetical protein [Chitinophagales bacterium]
MMRIILTSMIFYSLSCTKNPANLIGQKPYFDLTGYFDDQISRLYADSFIIIKTANINGKTDQHTMPWTDWRKELALFYASDINKSSFIGKYMIDTAIIGNREKKISYKAIDRDLRTNLIEVTLSSHDNSITRLHIVNKSDHFLSSNTEELYYEPLKSYIVKSTQQMKLFGNDSYSVKGDIVNKHRQYF